MISVVIPVYNVLGYLDKCLESVVNQTYKDIEIILINDGSTDGSDSKCQEWAKRDRRIVYHSKPNEGLGPTRNCGIKMARYDWIAFLDSDDWWNPAMLEKLYASVSENDSDMAMCYRYDVIINGENSSYTVNKDPIMFEPVVDNAVMQSKRLIHIIGNSAWGRLYRKSLFLDNNIWFPNVYCEDAAIMPYIATFCKRISCVKEPLYYYLNKRSGSILGTMSAAKTMIDCLKFVRREFEESGKIKKYYDAVKWLAYEFTTGTMRTTATLVNSQNKAERNAIIAELTDFLSEYYPNSYDKVYIWGSFNLRRSVGFGFPNFDNTRFHVMNCSIISLFAPPMDVTVNHNNYWRKQWLNMDFSKNTLQFIENRSGNDPVFIDFLEERYDIGECDGTYFTISEAFNDIVGDFELQYAVISRFDDRLVNLFRQVCDKFAGFLKSKFEMTQIYLVKMYLCEHYGRFSKDSIYEQVDVIRRTNALLDSYYTYFQESMPGINVIECSDLPGFFTDSSFPYGKYPHNLNLGCYCALGERLSLCKAGNAHV